MLKGCEALLEGDNYVHMRTVRPPHHGGALGGAD